MNPNLLLILGIDFVVLFAQMTALSISYDEALLLYEGTSLLHYIVSASAWLFGENDYALRLPMIFIHMFSTMLLYQISRSYLKRERDRLWLVVVYVLLPGVNSAALVVNEAGLVILTLFAFVLLYQQRSLWIYPLLASAFLVDASITYMYAGLFLYALASKQHRLALFSGLWFVWTLWFYAYDIVGTPKGHFLDALGVYSAIFSPMVFIYLFYVLYRRFVLKNRDLIWYLSTTALILSLILSFRQRVELHLFAPYLLLALPLAAQTFMNSYRVRLREFRRRYRVLFTISFTLLLLHAVVVLFNKELYAFVERPKDHFAYNMHIARELSSLLKSEGISCVDARDERMQLRLKFYTLPYCTEYRLETEGIRKEDRHVTISYSEKILFEAYVTKVLK